MATLVEGHKDGLVLAKKKLCKCERDLPVLRRRRLCCTSNAWRRAERPRVASLEISNPIVTKKQVGQIILVIFKGGALNKYKSYRGVVHGKVDSEGTGTPVVDWGRLALLATECASRNE